MGYQSDIHDFIRQNKYYIHHVDAPTLRYQVMKGNNDNTKTVVDSGATVLAVKSGSGSGSTELTFKLTGDDIKYSGEYTEHGNLYRQR